MPGLSDLEHFKHDSPAAFWSIVALSTLVVLMLVHMYMSAPVSGFSNTLYTGPGLALDSQLGTCRSTAGLESCGGAGADGFRSRAGFLSTRGSGPDFWQGQDTNTNYWANEITTPLGADSDADMPPGASASAQAAGAVAAQVAAQAAGQAASQIVAAVQAGAISASDAPAAAAAAAGQAALAAAPQAAIASAAKSSFRSSGFSSGSLQSTDDRLASIAQNGH